MAAHFFDNGSIQSGLESGGNRLQISYLMLPADFGIPQYFVLAGQSPMNGEIIAELEVQHALKRPRRGLMLARFTLSDGQIEVQPSVSRIRFDSLEQSGHRRRVLTRNDLGPRIPVQD